MKKNKMLRTASVLLILVMLTTSIIGGTFAKYTTTGKVSDTARVAKWGVVINTSGALFSNAYAVKTDSNEGLPGAWTDRSDASKITVAAGTETDNIVAPGTESYGEGLTFGITGTPEVATKVYGEIKARDIYLDTSKSYGVMVKATVNSTNWSALKTAGLYTKTAAKYSKVGDEVTGPVADTDYYVLKDATTAGGANTKYYPVVYTLEGSAKTTNTGISASSTKAVATALLNEMKKDSSTTISETTTNGLTTYTVSEDNAKVIAANTDLAGTNLFGNEKLTWKWEYAGTGDTDKNKEDTILGNMIAAVGNNDGVTSSDPYVVFGDATNGYTDVYYDATNKLAKTKSDGDILASLETKFDISLTVTQVD